MPRTLNDKAEKTGASALLSLLAKPPVERIIEIPTDHDAVAAVALAERAADDARRDVRVIDDDQSRLSLRAAEKDLADLRERVAKTLITLRLRALPRVDFEHLIESHPASDDEKAEGMGWGPSFNAALIAATLVEPTISESEAAEIYDKWPASEARTLFNEALNVNLVRPVVDLGKGWRPTRATGRNSASA